MTAYQAAERHTMYAKAALILVITTLGACQKEPIGYQSIREGQTAVVNACGTNWKQFLVDDIVSAIHDWNEKIRPRWGLDPFTFGGIAEEKEAYDAKSDDDGMNCIYLTTDATSTAETRRLAKEYPGKAALFMPGQDIIIWSHLPPYLLEKLALQFTVAHELGHGAWLGHADIDGPPSAMKERHRTRLVQPLDVENFCTTNGCE